MSKEAICVMREHTYIPCFHNSAVVFLFNYTVKITSGKLLMDVYDLALLFI